MRTPGLVICLIVSLGLAACATPVTISPQGSTAEIEKETRKQRELALKRGLQEEMRVRNVAYPVLKANRALCADTRLNAGLFFWNEHTLDKEYKNIANVHYGLGEVVQIRGVLKNSPADKAGITVGDKLIAINGKQIHGGKNGTKEAARMMRKIKTPDVEITISRDGQEITESITRAEICDYAVIYNAGDSSVNASADGKNIIIPRGMLRFIDNDTELALVVSHELAHNAMGHVSKQKQNAAMAAVPALLFEFAIAVAGGAPSGSITQAAINTGFRAYSVEFEQEADYVGMYFMARAGYETKGVADFWRRMAAENDDKGISNRSSHPTTPERFVAIEKTHLEIQDKRQSGVALEPAMDEEKKNHVYITDETRSGFND